MHNAICLIVKGVTKRAINRSSICANVAVAQCDIAIGNHAINGIREMVSLCKSASDTISAQRNRSIPQDSHTACGVTDLIILVVITADEAATQTDRTVGCLHRSHSVAQRVAGVAVASNLATLQGNIAGCLHISRGIGKVVAIVLIAGNQALR